jgi:ATP/maltotriose-dependent transcriptional regulator MalT
LEAAEKQIHSEMPCPGERGPELQAMLAVVSYVRSRITAMGGDIDRAIENCLAACANIPTGNLALYFDTRITLGFEYFLKGDYASAGQVLNETIRTAMTAGAVIYAVAASCVLARQVAVQGRLHESYSIYLRAAQLIPEPSGHLDAQALVDVGMADVLCEWNDLDAALAQVRQGLSLLPNWGKPDDTALAYVTLARIHLARANWRDAEEALEKASQITQGGGVFSEAREAVDVARVRLSLAEGDSR